MSADPNDALAAFTEYAADRLWTVSHLTQLAGVALMMAALIILSDQLKALGSARWTRIAAGGAIASLAIAAALQAVDGVALRRMVDTWAAASGRQKALLYSSTFAVRQIEVGLASMLSLIIGVTAVLYGFALAGSGVYPRWLGLVAIAGGAATAVSGVVMAYTGFSQAAMLINMPASIVLIAWMFVLGVLMWRRGGLDLL